MITERLRPGIAILFVGFNPSPASHEKGFNYAGPNNRFYRVLFESGLTDRLYTPEESPRLLDDYDYGFTNIVARPTQRADQLTRSEYAEGREILRDKLQRYQPSYACYVGKGVYLQFSKAKSAKWGFQPSDAVPPVRDFVAPSTSGLVRMKLREQVEVFQWLAEVARD